MHKSKPHFWVLSIVGGDDPFEFGGPTEVTGLEMAINYKVANQVLGKDRRWMRHPGHCHVLRAITEHECNVDHAEQCRG